MSQSVYTPAEVVPSVLEQVTAAGITAADSCAENPTRPGLGSWGDAKAAGRGRSAQRNASTVLDAESPMAALDAFAGGITAANLVARVTALRRRQREAARSRDLLFARAAVPQATSATERLAPPRGPPGTGAAVALYDRLGVAYRPSSAASSHPRGTSVASSRGGAPSAQWADGDSPLPPAPPLACDPARKSTCPSVAWPVQRKRHPPRFALINEDRDFFTPSLRRVLPNYDREMPPRPLSVDAATRPASVPLLVPVRPGRAGAPIELLPLDPARARPPERTAPLDAAHEARTLLLAARALLL